MEKLAAPLAFLVQPIIACGSWIFRPGSILASTLLGARLNFIGT
jgi:hypothetical protein